ncbi:hypothetical protein C8J57DRAFT_103694 [Mycena rebaudengoi]|nr:hypothetical protein C8J57DRAFT_103694 [Mycena rebaudengoi]
MTRRLKVMAMSDQKSRILRMTWVLKLSNLTALRRLSPTLSRRSIGPRETARGSLRGRLKWKPRTKLPAMRMLLRWLRTTSIRVKRVHNNKDVTGPMPIAKRQKGVDPSVSSDSALTAASVREIFGGMLSAYFPHLSVPGGAGSETSVTASHDPIAATVVGPRTTSPDVADPIGTQEAAILQLIADANAAAANETISGSQIGDSDSSRTMSSGKGVGLASRGTASVVVPHYVNNNQNDADASAAAAVDLVAKASAPYDLAAKQALAIVDYMHNSNAKLSTDRILSTRADEVKRTGDINSGKSAGNSKANKSSTVYQSDLETVKIKYDPLALCGVSDPFLQDKLLSPTYVGGGKKLLPTFLKQTDTFNYDLTGGHVSFSLWRNIIPTLDFDIAAPAVVFIGAPGGFINPSRVDPARISIQTTTADASLPRKWLTGLMHNQEYERFVALVCLAFGAAVVYGQLSNGGLLFQSRLGPPKGTGTGKDIMDSGLVSIQKGYTPSSVVVKNSLGFDDNIPVYDARNCRVNFQTDLYYLATKDVLPLYEGEIPFGSFVIVGYTMTGWNAVPAVHFDKIRHPHLGCNILWAIVVGVRNIDE